MSEKPKFYCYECGRELNGTIFMEEPKGFNRPVFCSEAHGTKFQSHRGTFTANHFRGMTAWFQEFPTKEVPRA